jgi:hypothetical protein
MAKKKKHYKFVRSWLVQPACPEHGNREPVPCNAWIKFKSRDEALEFWLENHGYPQHTIPFTWGAYSDSRWRPGNTKTLELIAEAELGG